LLAETRTGKLGFSVKRLPVAGHASRPWLPKDQLVDVLGGLFLSLAVTLKKTAQRSVPKQAALKDVFPEGSCHYLHMTRHAERREVSVVSASLEQASCNRSNLEESHVAVLQYWF
jgi:hypothetical protein